MSEIAIKARGLGKQYTIGGAETRYASFREMLTGAVKAPFTRFRRLSGVADDRETFWALRDLDFDIEVGDKVGVIGYNGAGKSTLLKILSRITSPTTGEAVIRGTASSLLEVGTGFHQELTGRENIYLNGSILGMSRRDIGRRFEEIVEFAEVSRFVDTPVKRYSSGMYVRLAFSVAAHLASDILIIDEVLAVGDQRFQDKSLGKLDDLGNEGRTVLFVSHNLSMVNRLCSKAMHLREGRLVDYSDVATVSANYAKSRYSDDGQSLQGLSGPLADAVNFERLDVNGKSNQAEVVVSPTDEIVITLEFVLKRDLQSARTTLSFIKDGLLVMSQHDTQLAEKMTAGRYKVRFFIDAKMLSPGRYGLTFCLSDSAQKKWVQGIEQSYMVISHLWLPEYQPEEQMGIINNTDIAQRTLISDT